ncbi:MULTISPECIES: rhomboid family intramembrane serine protease [Halolamina]|uniref:Membrane associated serine protease, rhomboid family n=1 Tax=Halolamina pelagica TaxID=699431 RepID=A0A1I5NPQ6_9EURY|nr:MULTISPECIES: rhomboid family intramembrane serine protease [Halolamina]NHX36421.1 rhomboid family intramembrane serine protease [Halolamina sp. R1-12]SFP23808.1 Membrane associated serine protease, rhomboid family [Halolamina pelagica]
MSVSPVLQFGGVPWALLQRLFVVGALLGGAALALTLDDGRLLTRLRERFVFGVPWGTVVTVLGILGVYLFVQGGYGHWYRPVVLPFRAWSYFEPLGMLVAGFAHAGPGHLLGNLFGALTLAPVVEYAVGHYPPEQRDPDVPVAGVEPPPEPSASRGRLDALRRNPKARAFLLFPLAVAVVGVVLTLFTVGAVIGFSGVVFAFAGFALARYPLAAVLALVASDLLNLVYNALQNPTVTASGRSRFVTPWWADIAIQGHAIGLLVGVVLAAVLLRRRDGTTPSPTRLWSGGVLLAASQSLWAVYWYRGGTEYVLYRAAGLGLVALAATVIVVAVAGPDWSPFSPGSGETTTDGDESRLRDLSVRQLGLVAIVITAALFSGPAVAVNLVSTEGDLPGEPATVRGYEVTYAEGVENEMVSAIPVTLFGETTQVTTSGVIVANPDRKIWLSVVPRGRLAANGRATVVVGGIGWRDTVTAVRRGWTAVGGDTAYAVALDHDAQRRTVFTSAPAQAEPRIAHQNVSVAAGNDSFYLLVSEGNETVRRPLPGTNESVTVRNVTFYGEDGRVVAVHNGTRVTVLREETYD